jgi:hypothetical protein
VVIGLDLDDPPADAVEPEPGADQVGCDCVNAARKEISADWCHLAFSMVTLWMVTFLRISARRQAPRRDLFCGIGATYLQHLEIARRRAEPRRYSATRLTEFE